MSFTSPSIANKGNKFHVGPIGPGANLVIVAKEILLFNLLQRVELQVPTIPVEFSNSLPTDSKHFQLANIKVDRLFSSTLKEDDRIIQKKLNGIPDKIISFSIKDISLIDKLIPINQSDQLLAIAIYSYTIEIRYMDNTGKLYAINVNSGPYYQRITVNSFIGRLEASLNIQCIFSKLYPILPSSVSSSSSSFLTSAHLSLSPSAYSDTTVSQSISLSLLPPYKPIRLWLRSKVIRKGKPG